MDEILYKEARNTVQALIKDKKECFARKAIWKYRKTKRALENYEKRLLQQEYTETELIFSSRTVANTFKNILQILQVILFRNFLTLQKNVDYLQWASITVLLPWKKLEFEKVNSVLIMKYWRNLKATNYWGR